MFNIISKEKWEPKNSRDRKSIQQPLDKKGKVNQWFNKLYGSDKNPFIGTNRDTPERRDFIRKTIDERIEKAPSPAEKERLLKIRDNLKKEL